MAARLTAYLVAVIVGVTFIAGLIVGAQREDDGPVDLMVVNGRVYTADGEGTEAEAVAIQGNRILRVGTTREIQRLRRAQTVVIDAKGGAVLPGFIDVDVRLLDREIDTPTVLPVGPKPLPSRGEELSAVRAATREAHRRGVTSVQTAGGTPDELEIYDELRRAGALSLRVYSALAIDEDTTSSELDELDELCARFSDDPLLKAGAARIVVDTEADEDLTPDVLKLLVAELDRRDWQIVIEARDDRAIEMALAAYKHAIETNRAPARGRRHRIEQTTSLGPVDLATFEAIGVVPTAAEPVSIDEAVDAITRQAAWASFDEQRKGMLVRDMLADVVVLTKDIFAHPDARLTDADVSVTIFDGKIVFQRGAETEY